MRNMLTKRQLSKHSGNEGPRYDPYHFDELTVELRKGSRPSTHTLHLGLGVWYERNGKTVTQNEEKAVAMWMRATGLTPQKFEEAYERLHGCPHRCPKCHGPLAECGGYVGEAVVYCDNEACDAGIVWTEPVTDAMIQ